MISQHTHITNMTAKICPFCQVVFDENKIKDHIGFEHLGLRPEHETIKETVHHEENDANSDSKNLHQYFECDECFTRFKNLVSYEKHVKFIHLISRDNLFKKPINQRYDCKLCNEKFDWSYSLMKHMRTDHKGLRKHCKECGKTFSETSGLRRHFSAEHKGFRLKCDMCDLQFKYDNGLTKHKRDKHSNKNKQTEEHCKLCNKTFQSSLKSHIISTHKKIRESCQKCNQTFSQLSSLYRHIRRTHDEEVKTTKYECEQCAKLFSQKDTLKRHIKSVHIKVNFKCEMCEHIFTRLDNLRKHVKKHHKYKTET